MYNHQYLASLFCAIVVYSVVAQKATNAFWNPEDSDNEYYTFNARDRIDVL